MGLAGAAKLTTTSIYKKGILGEGNTIFGVCYVRVKHYPWFLEELDRLRRSSSPPENQSRNARHDAAQNNYAIPDKSRCKYEMGCRTKRGQQSHQGRFSHSDSTLRQGQQSR